MHIAFQFANIRHFHRLQKVFASKVINKMSSSDAAFEGDAEELLGFDGEFHGELL